jgi:hypothetical protein
MKIRLGFVSNSSSCSFTCPVCGNSQFGWDWDEDPVCGKCNVHILKVENLLDYIIRKYELNKEQEQAEFKRDHRKYYD